MTAITNRSFPVFITRHKIELLLAVCWLIVHLILFSRHGIETGFEARKYIEEADNLLANGSVSTPNFWLYSVQIFLIAAAKKMQMGFTPVLLVQWAFSLYALLRFYHLASRLSTAATGFIIALLLVLNIPFQTFDCFLQTESLFHSFTILFTCYLLGLEKLTARNLLFIFLFLLLLCFTRPTGIFWFPCTFLYLLFRFFRGYSTLLRVSICLGTAIVFLFFLNMALGSGGELDLMLPYRAENIICGVATIQVPSDIAVSQNPNSLEGLAYYISHNTGQFVRLAWDRSIAFFGLQRSYYSTGHNLFLAICFYPVFVFAVFGIAAWLRKRRAIALYCVSLILITWCSVILSCDDWHNRFLLTVVPYFYLLSIPAVLRITRFFLSKQSKRSN